MRPPTDTLVLGIGNTLLTDDGAGVHAMHRVRSLLDGNMAGVEFLDGSTLSFALLPTIENFTRWIVLDAGQLQRPPGFIARFEGNAMDAFLGLPRRTAHEVGLADLVDMARLSGRLPALRTLIAVQPERVDWGLRPSGRVAAVLDELAAEAIGVLYRWDREASEQLVAKSA